MGFCVVHVDGCEKPPRRHHVIRFDKFERKGENVWTYCQNWRDKTDLAFGQFNVYRDEADARAAYELLRDRDGPDYTVRLYSVRALTMQGAAKAVKKMLLGKSAARITQIQFYQNQSASGHSDTSTQSAQATEQSTRDPGLNMDDIDRMLGPVGKGRKMVMGYMEICQAPVVEIGNSDPERKLLLTSLFALGVTDYIGRHLELDDEDMYDLASIVLTSLGNRNGGGRDVMNASDRAQPESQIANTVKAGFFAANKMFAKEDPSSVFALFEVISTDFET